MVPVYDQVDVHGRPGGACGLAIAGARMCVASRAHGFTMPSNVKGRSGDGDERSRTGGTCDQMDAGARASDSLDAGGSTMPSNVEGLRAQHGRSGGWSEPRGGPDNPDGVDSDAPCGCTGTSGSSHSHHHC